MLLFAALSCKDNGKDKALVPFFKALKMEIDDGKIINRYKNAPVDSIIPMYGEFREEFKKVYGDTTYSIAIDTYFDKQTFRPEHPIRKMFMLFAFQRYLNGQSVEFPKIIIECLGYQQGAREKYEAKRNLEYSKFDKLLKAKGVQIQKGDTIEAILPLVTDLNGNKHIVYANIGYPYYLDFSDGDDTLNVRAVVETKFYKDIGLDEYGNEDSINLVLRLKVIDLSNLTVTTGIPTEKIKVGDKLNLSLESYGHAPAFNTAIKSLHEF